MAFSSTQLATNQSRGFHRYKDTDVSLRVLSGAGYFDGALALQDGDTILLDGSDGIGIRKVDRTAGRVSLTSAGQSLHGSTQVLVTAATYAPTVLQNGFTFILQRAAGVAVTLPAPALGLKYKFIHGTPVLSSVGHVITATSEIINGSFVLGGAIQLVAAADTITFVSGTSIIGDECTIESDGTYWYCSGMSSADNAILGSDEA